MKISEMNNDQAAAALLRIAGPFGNLADDDEVMTMLDEIKKLKDGDVPVAKATAKMIPKFVTFGLSKHKRDLYEIIGALTMKPTTEVAKMNFLETIKVFQESFDDLASSFFPQFGGATMSSAGRLSRKSTTTDGADSTP